MQAVVVQQSITFMEKLEYQVCGLIHDGFFVKGKGLTKSKFDTKILVKLNDYIGGTDTHKAESNLEKLP